MKGGEGRGAPPHRPPRPAPRGAAPPRPAALAPRAPSARRVGREGSLVSVDVGAIIEGWHGDAARTYIVGEVPDAARRLVDATREAMYAGIAAATPGRHIGGIF